jgi:NAD(P)-dependent dehydrogenase (short-subunit alcohol dehydrogenase family)
MSFEGRRAIVTGAASGIGKAVALHLLREGALVTAVDVNEGGLAEAREAGADVLATDLSDEAGRSAVIDSAAAEPVSFLVNAAGILGLKPIWDVTQADFRRIFAVNLESTWFLCRDVGRQMADGGAIVNFSSPSARWAYTLETAPYSATKTAIQATTRTFAVALAPRRIRVNAISPGITDTPMQETVLQHVSALRGQTYEELAEERLKLVPLKRSAPAEEMAGVVVWMLSDTAAYLTGQTIYVDGGYIMSA